MTTTITQTTLPPGLEELPPGPELGAALAGVDVTVLSGYDQVVVLRAQQRQVSHHQAQVYAAMAAIHDTLEADYLDDPADAYRAAGAEIRAALRLTRYAAHTDLDQALALRDRHPAVQELLVSGRIDARRARVLVDGTCHLDETVARRVVGELLDAAPGLTTGQLRARIRKRCIDTDPQDAARRYTQALADRRVVAELGEDGTASLFGLDLAPDRVAAIMGRIDALARSLRGGDEPRSLDQLRADVFCDLLAGRPTGGKGAVVDLHVDLATLAELNDHAGELAGFGPVIADIARQVAETQPGAEWRWRIVDPATGQPLANGTTRRRPTAAQRRHVECRDGSCVFPGCRRPAAQSQLDHRLLWSRTGTTRIDDLAPLCDADHPIRHTGWTYLRLPNGDYHWTSPLGHPYTTSGQPP